MARRLTAFDIAQAGSMELLVQQTVEQVKYGNMETKAFGSSVLRSLTEMHAWSAPQGKSAAMDGGNPPKEEALNNSSSGNKAVPDMKGGGGGDYMTADNIAMIVKMEGIKPLIQTLTIGTSYAQRDASGALADVSPPTLPLPLRENPPLFQLIGGAMPTRQR